jgi:hypothetical protein
MKTRPSASFFFCARKSKKCLQKKTMLTLSPDGRENPFYPFFGIKRLEGQRDFAY